MNHKALMVGISTPQRRATIDKITATDLFTEIHSIEDGETAFESLDKRPVSMIFCSREDISIDSLLWLRSLQKRDEYSDIPVLILCDSMEANERILALDLGASDCISPRISIQEMAARIRVQLRQKERMDQMRKVKSDLARLALTDPLTSLYNRAFFDVTLEAEIARSERSGKPFSLMLLDLDHFKKVNDTFGHQAGDVVLQEVAKCLGKTVRRSDTPCRYGGEEFALILPETNAPQAFQLASRIHKRLAAIHDSHRLHDHRVTISIGITCVSGNKDITAQEMVEQADCALYAAKRKGRNRTEMFTAEDPVLSFPQYYPGMHSEYAFA